MNKYYNLRLAILLFTICTMARIQAQDFRAVSTDVAQHIQTSGRKSVAVIDFTDLEGKPTKLGRYLAEEFSLALLSDARGFDVIDRTHLNTVLQEHKLATTGLIDPATARQLGKIAGVETLVTGTMTPFEEHVHLTLKVLDTETAKMVAAASYDVPKTKTIGDLMGSEPAPNASSNPRTTSNPQTNDLGPMPPPINMDELAFVPKGCINTGSSTTCSFSITNNSESSHSVEFLWMSFLVDENGHQFQGNRITFGSGDLIPGVAMNLAVEARDVPRASKLMSASLSYQIDFGRKTGKVMIRNIPISQR